MKYLAILIGMSIGFWGVQLIKYQLVKNFNWNSLDNYFWICWTILMCWLIV